MRNSSALQVVGQISLMCLYSAHRLSFLERRLLSYAWGLGLTILLHVAFVSMWHFIPQHLTTWPLFPAEQSGLPCCMAAGFQESQVQTTGHDITAFLLYWSKKVPEPTLILGEEKQMGGACTDGRNCQQPYLQKQLPHQVQPPLCIPPISSPKALQN